LCPTQNWPFEKSVQRGEDFNTLGTPVWKGELAYAGRSFPAKILTGARAESISFSQLHKTDASRVKQVLYCAAEDKAVAKDDLVKAYEYEKDRFIVIEAAEIKSLAPDPPAVIELKEFFPLDQVDPLCFESSYYVVPGGADAEPGYAALFRALCRTELAGLAAGVCFYSRERPLLFRAGASGIVAHALLYSQELRHVDQFRTNAEMATRADVAAAAEAMAALKVDFDPLGRADLQRERTERLIATKVAAVKLPAKAGVRKGKVKAA